MLYQRISIASAEPVGEPAPLAEALIGLADESLADLPAALDPCPPEWLDTGFLPVEPTPSLDDLKATASSQVYALREQHLAAGFDYDFGDARGTHHIGTTPSDMTGWDEVTKGAAALVALGQGATSFAILTETGPVTVTALEWQAILAQATAIRQPIWHRSFALIAAVGAAADASALAAIDIEDGWLGSPSAP